MEHQIPIFSFFLFNTNNHEYPQITQKFIHEKFVFIHGHSCFLQKIIRRAKLHAATPFVQFAQFADKRTLHVGLLKRRIERIKRIVFFVVFFQKTPNTYLFRPNPLWKSVLTEVSVAQTPTKHLPKTYLRLTVTLTPRANKATDSVENS
ncbi:MAG: hypothetical protein IKQ59_06305 [Prevotella sp.]|nr:hypothetical protein [Prevotella sp.]